MKNRHFSASKLKEFRNMKNILVIMVLSLLLIAGCVDLKEKPTVSSSGTAVLKVDPDKADIVIAIEKLDKSAVSSKDSVAAIVEKIYEKLYAIGVPRNDVVTEYFNMYEEFEWTSEGGRKSLGYKTVHTLKITTDDFSTIGDIVDAAVDAGATSVQSISFDISEQRRAELKRQALEQASRDARGKAEAIASGLNGRLGDIVSVSDVAYDYIPYRTLAEPVMAESAKAEVATRIDPKQLEVTATIQAVFEIES